MCDVERDVVDELLAENGERQHDGVVRASLRDLGENCGGFRGDFVDEAFSVAQHESGKKNEASNSIGNSFGDFGDDCSTIAVSDQNKIAKIFADDSVDDGFRADGVIYVAVGAFTLAGDGGGEGFNWGWGRRGSRALWATT